MNRPTRWAAAALLCLVPLASMTYADPDWPADAGLDLWNVPSLRAQIDRWQRQGHELDDRLRATQRRLDFKNRVATEVLAGEMTLREAARAYRAANANNPQFVPQMRLVYLTGSEDELHARNVIGMIRGILERDRQQDEKVARFEKELQAMKRCGEVELDE